jgi:iron(III) transport system ATP-binding protein
MQISIRNLTKSFGSTPVLHSISLEIRDGELFFLLGPSGCGKTTLLRLIAGFYPPDNGDIRFGDRDVSAVPPHQRNAGMVFQSYALWPHMTVAENVAYGLEVRNIPPAERNNRVREALAMVRMEELAARSPNQLSGGQQQRVALARALVIRPDVLLLDEPLSNLDARLRLEMRDEIRRLHSELKLTTVYVTHDQKEALSLADRMAVLKGGVVEQLADPRTVYRRPSSRFVADFIGEANWLEGEIVRADADAAVIRTGLGEFASTPRAGLRPSMPVWLGIRPEALHAGGAELNRFDAELHQTNYLGEIEEYVLRAGGTTFKCFVQNPELALAAGTRLKVSVRPDDLLVLPR